jgi:hypothetical protein
MASELGALGAIESWTKLRTVEHAEVLPAASVAVAVYAVEAFEAAVTAKPDAKLAAVPVETGLPAQVALA